jgi:hypothetical protein
MTGNRKATAKTKQKPKTKRTGAGGFPARTSERRPSSVFNGAT